MFSERFTQTFCPNKHLEEHFWICQACLSPKCLSFSIHSHEGMKAIAKVYDKEVLLGVMWLCLKKMLPLLSGNCILSTKSSKELVKWPTITFTQLVTMSSVWLLFAGQIICENWHANRETQVSNLIFHRSSAHTLIEIPVIFFSFFLSSLYHIDSSQAVLDRDYPKSSMSPVNKFGVA